MLEFIDRLYDSFNKSFHLAPAIHACLCRHSTDICQRSKEIKKGLNNQLGVINDRRSNGRGGMFNFTHLNPGSLTQYTQEHLHVFSALLVCDFKDDSQLMGVNRLSLDFSKLPKLTLPENLPIDHLLETIKTRCHLTELSCALPGDLEVAGFDLNKQKQFVVELLNHFSTTITATTWFVPLVFDNEPYCVELVWLAEEMKFLSHLEKIVIGYWGRNDVEYILEDSSSITALLDSVPQKTQVTSLTFKLDTAYIEGDPDGFKKFQATFQQFTHLRHFSFENNYMEELWGFFDDFFREHKYINKIEYYVYENNFSPKDFDGYFKNKNLETLIFINREDSAVVDTICGEDIDRWALDIKDNKNLKTLILKFSGDVSIPIYSNIFGDNMIDLIKAIAQNSTLRSVVIEFNEQPRRELVILLQSNPKILELFVSNRTLYKCTIDGVNLLAMRDMPLRKALHNECDSQSLRSWNFLRSSQYSAFEKSLVFNQGEFHIAKRAVVTYMVISSLKSAPHWNPFLNNLLWIFFDNSVFSKNTKLIISGLAEFLDTKDLVKINITVGGFFNGVRNALERRERKAAPSKSVKLT